MSIIENTTIPEGALKWKLVKDYILKTPLGEDICQVQMLDSDEYKVLRAGEDERIRRFQIKLFCEWLIQKKESFDPEELKYILLVLGIKQATLAKSLALTEGAVSQFLSKESKWKLSTHRQVSLSFLKELNEPGSILKLAMNKSPYSEKQDNKAFGVTIKSRDTTFSPLGVIESYRSLTSDVSYRTLSGWSYITHSGDVNQFQSKAKPKKMSYGN